MTLRVLIVDDDPDVRWWLTSACKDAGCEVFEADSLAAGRKSLAQEPDLILLDLMFPDGEGLGLLPDILSRNPAQLVIVISAYGTVERAVEAMSHGAWHFLAKPFSTELLVRHLDRAKELRRLQYTAAQVQRAADGGGVPAQGAALRQVEEAVGRVARSNAKVLLLGPSGCGKTHYARRIHMLSERPGNFVEANCGAIAPGLIESELFGHEKGAFTDAKALKRGVFEQADGGTLLLDEIGDMPLELQVKLLTVVEQGQVTRLGAEKPVKVDVRLICATHRDLEALVKQGTFREDLFYRLAVGVIRVPSLKERGYEDFLALAEVQLLQFARENGRRFQGIEPRAGELLYLYPWGGNVRELRNILERVVIFEDGEALTVEMVRRHLGSPGGRGPAEAAMGNGFVIPEPWPTLEAVKEQYYQHVVQACGGNLSEAARILGVSRKTLERERSAGKV